MMPWIIKALMMIAVVAAPGMLAARLGYRADERAS
jgi:hypothetical protein